jgi:ribosomal protein S18 acetylase RimI-like enzyme
LLGSLGATIEPGMGIATVGYWLDEAALGRGVARRSVDALVWVLLQERGMRHVGLTTAVDNTRSRALAERCGFRFDRLLPPTSTSAGAMSTASRTCTTTVRPDALLSRRQLSTSTSPERPQCR